MLWCKPTFPWIQSEVLSMTSSPLLKEEHQGGPANSFSLEFLSWSHPPTAALQPAWAGEGQKQSVQPRGTTNHLDQDLGRGHAAHCPSLPQTGPGMVWLYLQPYFGWHCLERKNTTDTATAFQEQPQRKNTQTTSGQLGQAVNGIKATSQDAAEHNSTGSPF